MVNKWIITQYYTWRARTRFMGYDKYPQKKANHQLNNWIE